jgi:type IV secretion system protein VirB4
VLALKSFRSRAAGLPDLLNWAALIGDGIVQGKDGSLLAGWFYRGPDIASSTDDERNWLTGRINAALARLGSGWVTWVEAVRLPASGYPAAELSHFPDPVSRLIDEERRRQFLRERLHYESEYALLVQYTPPLRRKSKVADIIYDDDPGERVSPAGRILELFDKALADIEDAICEAVSLRRMRSFVVTDTYGREHLRDELVNYLHFALTGETVSLNIPAAGAYLDAVLGGRELWPGDTPRLGDRFICCIAVEGFPTESFPGILDSLDHLAIAYRWSTRMIYLDQHEALAELRKFRRKWKQQVRGFWTQVFKTQGGSVNEDALLMSSQADAAIADASSALVAFGYYTPVIVLMDSDRATLTEKCPPDHPGNSARRLQRPSRDGQHDGSVARLASWSSRTHAGSYRQPRRHAASSGRLDGARRKSLSVLPGALPSPPLRRHRRRHAIPGEPARRRCRPYTGVRADRRRQVHPPQHIGTAGSALS